MPGKVDFRDAAVAFVFSLGIGCVGGWVSLQAGALAWLAALVSILVSSGVALFLLKRLSRPHPSCQSPDALFTSSEQYHAALAAAGVGAWVWNLETGGIVCSDHVFELLGRGEHKSGCTIDDLKGTLFKEDREVFELAVNRVQSGQQRSPVDCRFVRMDGTLVWVELAMRLVVEGAGRTSIAASMKDITERKEIERQLEQGTAYLEAILESTDSLVFSMDREYRLRVANRRFLEDVESLFNVQLNLGDYMGVYLPENLKKTWLPRYEQVLAGDSLVLEDSVEIGGQTVFLDVSIKPIRENGVVNGVATICLNVTSQKQREKEWLRAKEQAEESDRLKSAFLANMSHEIRTPLNAVMGFAQLLKSASITPEEHERFLDVILSNGAHLLNILGDIIDLAQIESNQLRVEVGPCDLGLLMAESYSVFKDRIRSQAAGQLDLLIDESLMQTHFIACDQTRLKQVLYNLVSNSIKFTLVGSISISYRVLPGSLVEFRVVDTGTGIPSEMKERVFQRFRQGDEKVGRENDGVGLGLSICEGLVRLLGGDIWIEDNEPSGTVFKFTVRDHSDSVPLDGEYLRSSKSAAKDEDRVVGSTLNVLVAEDDDTNFLVIEEFLRFLELKPVRAVNGAEAIRAIETDCSVDLVIMDISMPVLDGLEATKRIKEIRPDLPVIAHTAHAMKGELDRALAAGCSDCLVKPINIERFREILVKYANC